MLFIETAVGLQFRGVLNAQLHREAFPFIQQLKHSVAATDMVQGSQLIFMQIVGWLCPYAAGFTDLQNTRVNGSWRLPIIFQRKI